jgi:hypothetical protein
MTPKIHCDKSVVIGQIRVHLPAPCKPALRNTMNEQDGTTAWIASLNKVELYATAACDSVVLHQHPPVMALARSPFSLVLTSHARKAGTKIAAPNAAKALANFFGA